MTTGALEGLMFCGNILIPSLFPFMVLSSFLVYSGASKAVSGIFEAATKKVFKLPGSAGATVLLSMTGGYPVGARGIKSLLDEKLITREQACRMLYFCVGGGPAFVIFAVGQSLLNSVYYGIVLLIVQMISQLIIGIAVGAKHKRECSNQKKNKILNTEKIYISEALVKACGDAVSGMLNLCGMVVLFSAAIGILQDLRIEQYFENALTFSGIDRSIAKSILPCLLEVTGGCNTACASNAPLELIAFAIGFGGFCVHMQVYCAVGNIGLNKKIFTLCRFIQGILCALFTHIILKIYNPSPASEVFSNVSSVSSNGLSVNFFASIALIVTSICFLLSVKLTKKKDNAYNIR